MYRHRHRHTLTRTSHAALNIHLSQINKHMYTNEVRRHTSNNKESSNGSQQRRRKKRVNKCCSNPFCSEVCELSTTARTIPTFTNGLAAVVFSLVIRAYFLFFVFIFNSLFFFEATLTAVLNCYCLRLRVSVHTDHIDGGRRCHRQQRWQCNLAVTIALVFQVYLFAIFSVSIAAAAAEVLFSLRYALFVRF